MEHVFFKSQKCENWKRDGIRVRDRQRCHRHINLLKGVYNSPPSWFADTDKNILYLGSQYGTTMKTASYP